MIKRITILLTFLAYALSLVHSVVPHHHHDNTAKDHHDHSTDHHHHNSDDDASSSSVIHFFSEAVHHPSSQFVLHSNASEYQQKYNNTSVLEAFALYATTISDREPPGVILIDHDTGCDDSYFKISLLRAPPAFA